MSTKATATSTVEMPTSGADVFMGYPWEGLARLVDRAPSLDDLRAHRIQLFAAALHRQRGLPVPSELAEEARLARISTLMATALLKRVRGACSGPLLVFKGLEVAARYPAPALRDFADVDVLVPQPEEAQRQLEAAGFSGVGGELDWDTLHHLQRLAPPDLPCSVEVHRHPKWVAGLPEPRVEELLADAVPSATGVDGVLAPSPAAHAVLLAAHAWAERPLGRIGDLVDIAAIVSRTDEDLAHELARRYGLERVWRTTVAAAAALFWDDGATWPLRTWARHLPEVRERSVFESHLERLLAPFSGLPPAQAARASGRQLVRTAKPSSDESWRAKLARSRWAFRHAFRRRSEHERHLRDGKRGS